MADADPDVGEADTFSGSAQNSVDDEDETEDVDEAEWTEAIDMLSTTGDAVDKDVDDADDDDKEEEEEDDDVDESKAAALAIVDDAGEVDACWDEEEGEIVDVEFVVAVDGEVNEGLRRGATGLLWGLGFSQRSRGSAAENLEIIPACIAEKDMSALIGSNSSSESVATRAEGRRCSRPWRLSSLWENWE